MKTVKIVLVGLAVGLLALPGAARASGTLRQQVTALAADIKKALDEAGQRDVAVGEFTGPPNPATSSGPGLQLLLIQALQALGVAVRPEAEIFVKGEYLIADEGKEGGFTIRLEVVLRNKRGRKLLELQKDLKANDDIVRLLATTVSLQHLPKADRDRRNDSIRHQVNKPSVHIDGAKVSAKAGSPYAVELRVGGKGRAAREEKGQAFAAVAKGEVYEVILHNRSKHDAAVSLTIDGLDVFAFSEVRNAKTGRPRYTHFVIPAGKAAKIVGWHHTNERASSFQVVDLSKSALAKATKEAELLRSNPAIGTVTACFHLAWTGKEPPEEERGARDGGGATGFGPPRETKLKEVQRSIGVLREAVTIRYSRP